MWNTGISVGGSNLNNLRYADDTTLLADSEGKLQRLWDVVIPVRENASTPRSNKKQDTKLLSITSPNNDRFLKFFHCYTQQEICNEDIITDPATP